MTTNSRFRSRAQRSGKIIDHRFRSLNLFFSRNARYFLFRFFLIIFSSNRMGGFMNGCTDGFMDARILSWWSFANSSTPAGIWLHATDDAEVRKSTKVCVAVHLHKLRWHHYHPSSLLSSLSLSPSPPCTAWPALSFYIDSGFLNSKCKQQFDLSPWSLNNNAILHLVPISRCLNLLILGPTI